MDAPELDYTEIAPYDDSQFAERVAEMVKEPGFEHAVRWVLPDVDYEQFVSLLRSTRTKKDFQINIMQKFLEELEAHTSARNNNVRTLRMSSRNCRMLLFPIIEI